MINWFSLCMVQTNVMVMVKASYMKTFRTDIPYNELMTITANSQVLTPQPSPSPHGHWQSTLVNFWVSEHSFKHFPWLPLTFNKPLLYCGEWQLKEGRIMSAYTCTNLCNTGLLLSAPLIASWNTCPKSARCSSVLKLRTSNWLMLDESSGVEPTSTLHSTSPPLAILSADTLPSIVLTSIRNLQTCVQQ